jgi:hypothetical protein
MLETDDLFLGALGLVRGGELHGIEVRGTNGRRVAVFAIVGPGADAAASEYHRGPALVDLRLLKSEVRRLKEAAFGAIREADASSGSQSRRGNSQKPRSAGGSQEGNRMD